jgi:hypothetical protein
MYLRDHDLPFLLILALRTVLLGLRVLCAAGSISRAVYMFRHCRELPLSSTCPSLITYLFHSGAYGSWLNRQDNMAYWCYRKVADRESSMARNRASSFDFYLSSQIMTRNVF